MKLRSIINGFIILSYIFLIGSLIVNNDNFIFKEDWLMILNIVLLCIGFYYFVTYSSKEK